MRIGIITYFLNVGGVESVMLSLGRELKSRGLDVTYVETVKKGDWSDYFRNSGMSVVTIPINKLFSKTHHVKKIAVELNQYDFLIINDAPYAVSALGLLKPEIISVTVLHNAIESMIVNALGFMNQVDSAIGITPSLCSMLKKRTDNVERIKYIGNGVKVSKIFRPINSINKKRILYLGRIEHNQKGVLYLPEIFKRIYAEDTSVTLTIIGDGPDLFKLKKLIEVENFSHAVVFKGKLDQEQVEIELNNHGILLMPSFFEGHPISLLEAMSKGLVPVVSLIEGHTDIIVEHEHNGKLCEIGNVEDFAKQCSLLLKDKTVYDMLSEAAVSDINDKFSIQKMADSYLETYQKNLRIVKRSNTIDKEILMGFVDTPFFLIRPIRKIKTMLNITRNS
jgi:glycosyltransferase involved in cell wall biosynthesis